MGCEFIKRFYFKLKSIHFLNKLIISIFIILSSFALFAEETLTVKVGYFYFPGYQEGSSDEERKDGYGYEYLQKIASYTGWRYEYVYGERVDLIKQLNDGEIDLLVGLPKETDGNNNIVYSRRPTIISTYYLFQSPASKPLNVVYPETFNGAKIGVIKDSEAADFIFQYLQKLKSNCEIIYYTDYKEYLAAFFENRFDAFISTDLELSDNSYVRMIDTVGNHPLFAGFSNKNPKIAEMFNEAQERIREVDPLYLENLGNKYFNARISNLISNKKDFKWLKNNNKLVIGYIDDYLPFCTSHSGKEQGLMFDILKQIGSFVDLSNLEIEYKPYLDYQVALEDLKNGTVDVIFPFYGDLWYVEKYGVQKTSDIYMLSMVLIGNRKNHTKEYKTIAVSKKSPLQIYYVNHYFPDAELVYFDTYKDCVDAVENGNVDATISNRYKTTWYMKTNQYAHLDMVDLKEECPVTFAVRYDSIDLLAFLNGTLSQVDDDYRNNSLYMNSFNNITISFGDIIREYAFVEIIVLIVIALVIFILSHISVTRNKKRSLVMRMQKLQLETLLREEKINSATIRSVSKMYIALYYINMQDYNFKEMDVMNQNIHEIIGSEGNAIIKYREMHKNLVVSEHIEMMEKFDDLTTLKDRIGDKTYISIEFKGPHMGWCEAIFIVSDRDSSGDFGNVIYAVRSIEKEKELQARSNTDELTGCYNRRSYEEDVSRWNNKELPQNLIVVSMDVNGLKNANDGIGHDAGDELIMGSARCIETVFNSYGKVYRVGGDEFIAIIQASENEYIQAKNSFENAVSNWHGKLLPKLSISYGAASVSEFPDKTITDIAKISDKRMYESKEHFYSTIGVDRRSSQTAFETLKVTFTKILKVNLATEEFSIMFMKDEERQEANGYRDSLSEWLKSFADAGLIHKNDKEEYLEKTNINYMRNYFNENKGALSIRYRKLVGKKYKPFIMDIVPVSNYSATHQVVFLYVKNVE